MAGPRRATLQAHAHPVFSFVYGTVAALTERGEIGRVRGALLSGAAGTVLVVGLGPGHDLDHVPPSVSQVVALEPGLPMLRRAAPRVRALRARGGSVLLAAGVAEALPLADASVDAVLLAFVLCSVADPARALAEARRVLRPHGRLLLLEHVRGPEGSLLARVQDRVDPWWHRLAGGDSLTRDPSGLLRAAGFDVTGLTYRWMANFPLCAYHLVGTATVGPRLPASPPAPPPQQA